MNWKRVLLIILIVLILVPLLLSILTIVVGGVYIGTILFLSALPVQYEFLQETQHIQSIELVYLDEDDNIHDEHFDNVTVGIVLDECEFTAFMNDLEDVTCRHYSNDPPFVVEGASIWITYDNGWYEILSDVGTYYSAGTNTGFTAKHFDSRQLLALLEKYGYQKPE